MESLADCFGIVIPFVHHTRKAGAINPFSPISGTTSFNSDVDSSLVMAKDERIDNRSKLYVTGRDTPDTQLVLIFYDFHYTSKKQTVEQSSPVFMQNSNVFVPNSQKSV